MRTQKLHYPRIITMVITLLVLGIAFAGYALYFNAQKKLIEFDKSLVHLRADRMRVEDNFNELKKKNMEISELYNQSKNNDKLIVQQQQECKEKLEELQLKYDSMKQSFEVLQLELKNARARLGEKEPEPNPTQPSDFKIPSATPDTNNPLEKSKGNENLHPTSQPR